MLARCSKTGIQMWSNTDKGEEDAPVARGTQESDIVTDEVENTEPQSTVILTARGDSRPDNLPPFPTSEDEPKFVVCPECTSRNILGTWYCDNCHAILETGEYENPNQQATAAKNLEHAAKAFAQLFDAKWTFRHARGEQSDAGKLRHEIRNKSKRAGNLGYNSIAHRFHTDSTFRTQMLALGHTIDTMQNWDHIASLRGEVQGIPYEERIERFGSSRAMLVLTSKGRGTHRVEDAPNYQSLLDEGPPSSPSYDPRPAKGSRKGKGKGRSHSNPQQSYRRQSSSSQSSSWHPYSWQSSQWW